MTNYKLFLDDIREPRDCVHYMKSRLTIDTQDMYGNNADWVVVRDYNEFKTIISNIGIPGLISFDHDLAPEHYTPEEYWDDYEKSKAYQDAKQYTEKTGEDCAKWLVEYCKGKGIHTPIIIIHSMNPVGVNRIANALKDGTI